MENLDKNISQAVITLGGRGTRLSSITKEIPKALWLIDGIHTFERTIANLSAQGINKFILLLDYKSDIFKKEAKKISKKYAISIKTYLENSPMGEAGGLLDIIQDLEELFLFIHGDIIFDIDLGRFINFHIRHSADITFMTHLTNHPFDSDCISESKSFQINSYKLKTSKDSSNEYYLGNAGIALISKSIVNFIKQKFSNQTKKLSLFKDFIILAHENGYLVFSYNTSEYLKDMGTPKRLKTVENDIKSGKVKKNSYRVLQKVLFLDRDNTLIKSNQNDYIINKDFEFYNDRIYKLSKIAKDFNFVVMVTNQPQISMGYISYQAVLDINIYVILKCQELGLNISCAYICPHHPHIGFKNEVSILKTSCFCRKPSPGMFFEASINRNISLQDSLLIGDSWRDKESARYSKMKFIDVNYLDSSSYT